MLIVATLKSRHKKAPLRAGLEAVRTSSLGDVGGEDVLWIVDRKAQLSTGCIVGCHRQAHGGDADAGLDVNRVGVINRSTGTFGVDVELDLGAFLGLQHDVGQQAVSQAGLVVSEVDGH